MKTKFWDVPDYILFTSVFILIILGIAFIYSSGINSQGILVTNEYIKQIIWALLGIVLMILSSLYDYSKFERYAQNLYIGLLIVLLYTCLFGRYVNGARSWLGIGDFGIQPSEFGKIIFIIFLAHYLSETKNENQLRRFITAIAFFILPIGLILIQPDLGTASVYIPIFLVMCFMAGIPIRYVIFILGIGTCTIFLTILPVWNNVIAKKSFAVIGALTIPKLRLLLIITSLLITIIGIIGLRYLHGKKYFYWISYFFLIMTISFIFSFAAGNVLKDYQIKRLIVYMDPAIDPLGSGWNIIQSKIAIGSGGIFGRTFLHGTQSHYRFLPQQSTDFIFSILSEELGFAGGLFVFILYAIIFQRTIKIIRNSSSRFGCYIASGILAMFAFHFFINVGMVMGIMPITGIPLLFLSYGGSSLWTAMICIGMLMSINYRKYNK
ncbi:MAG: rod shape-determining protein RodA [Treponema sp.]|nr:rod shape-determining protein RodA [Treponema sp.]